MTVKNNVDFVQFYACNLSLHFLRIFFDTFGQIDAIGYEFRLSEVEITLNICNLKINNNAL